MASVLPYSLGCGSHEPPPTPAPAGLWVSVLRACGVGWIHGHGHLLKAQLATLPLTDAHI